MGFLRSFDNAVAASPVGWFFRLEGSGHVSALNELPEGRVTDRNKTVQILAGYTVFGGDQGGA
jgi:hypothetical protein